MRMDRSPRTFANAPCVHAETPNVPTIQGVLETFAPAIFNATRQAPQNPKQVKPIINVPKQVNPVRVTPTAVPAKRSQTNLLLLDKDESLFQERWRTGLRKKV